MKREEQEKAWRERGAGECARAGEGAHHSPQKGASALGRSRFLFPCVVAASFQLDLPFQLKPLLLLFFSSSPPLNEQTTAEPSTTTSAVAKGSDSSSKAPPSSPWPRQTTTTKKNSSSSSSAKASSSSTSSPPSSPSRSLHARLRRMAAEEHPYMYGEHSLAARFASRDPRGSEKEDGSGGESGGDGGLCYKKEGKSFPLSLSLFLCLPFPPPSLPLFNAPKTTRRERNEDLSHEE